MQKAVDSKTKKELLILLLILLFSLAVRLAFLHEPLERDEGTYAYIGQEILRGAIPYRDVVDLKPPGIFYLYAFIIAVFGNAVESIRLFTAFYVVATTFSLYLFTRFLYGSLAGLIASFFYALFASGPMIQGNSSNSEVFLALPLLLGAYFLVRGVESGNRGCFCWSGFFTIIAVLIKTVVLPFFPLYCLWPLLSGTGKKFSARIADVAAFVLPPLLLVILVVGYFVSHGALHDLIYWNTAFSKIFSRPPDILERIVVGLRLSGEYLLLWLIGVPTACWLLVRKSSKWDIFVAALIPASMVAVALPGWFSPHYFILMVPFLAIVSGAGLSFLWQRRGWGFYATLPVIVAAFLYTVKLDYPYYFVYSPAEVSINKYGGYRAFAQSVEIANYIKKRTTAGDYIFQWGWEPELYFLSERRSPNKYIYSLLVAAAEEPAGAIRELTETIRTKKPKYIVMQKDEPTAQHSRLPGFSELGGVLYRDYVLDNAFGYAILFRLKE